MTSSDDNWPVSLDDVDDESADSRRNPYACTVCGTEFGSQGDAARCEWHHTTGGTLRGTLSFVGAITTPIAVIVLLWFGQFLWATLALVVCVGCLAILGRVSESGDGGDE